MYDTRLRRVMFSVGDHVAGAVTGAATAGVVGITVTPAWDMALAMVAGMGIGMAVHVVLMLLCGPVLGMFQVMVPGSLIGMYGGMIFGMRDSMVHGDPHGYGVLAGAFFGLIVVAAVHAYDWALRARD